MARITGRCLCGECSYQSNDEPLNIRACHCRRCQQATGSAFYPRLMVPLDSIEISGPVGWFAFDSGLRRGFCTRCGSTLFSERQSTNAIGIAMGSLDEPEQYSPTCHIWTSSKQPWLCLADGLPQHQEGP